MLLGKISSDRPDLIPSAPKYLQFFPRIHNPVTIRRSLQEWNGTHQKFVLHVSWESSRVLQKLRDRQGYVECMHTISCTSGTNGWSGWLYVRDMGRGTLLSDTKWPIKSVQFVCISLSIPLLFFCTDSNRCFRNWSEIYTGVLKNSRQAFIKMIFNRFYVIATFKHLTN